MALVRLWLEGDKEARRVVLFFPVFWRDSDLTLYDCYCRQALRTIDRLIGSSPRWNVDDREAMAGAALDAAVDAIERRRERLRFDETKAFLTYVRETVRGCAVEIVERWNHPIVPLGDPPPIGGPAPGPGGDDPSPPPIETLLRDFASRLRDKTPMLAKALSMFEEAYAELDPESDPSTRVVQHLVMKGDHEITLQEWFERRGVSRDCLYQWNKRLRARWLEHVAAWRAGT